MPGLPLPPAGDPEAATAWVGEHLRGLWSGPLAASGRFRGGAGPAAAALDALDVGGYASGRSEVAPPGRRRASALSPYIRHGLLTLPQVWDAVGAGPHRDVQRFRDELLWQEYARHLYARLGTGTARPLRAQPPEAPSGPDAAEPWDRSMACIASAVAELEEDGWLVNQARMWLASQWTVRHGQDWRAGERRFFTHLLDGSRAANRLGWQWTTGAATGRPYGFSRWQVEKRAPGTCAGCQRRRSCPIESWPPERHLDPVAPDPALRHVDDPTEVAGPAEPWPAWTGDRPDAVWLTAESLGDGDPALSAHDDLPAVWVWDVPLLRRLQLSAKRLVFLAETLGDLGARRALEVHAGDPVEVLSGRRLAGTFTPVPGWRARSGRIGPVEVHPWPWLRRPGTEPVTSYSAWRGRRR